MELDYKILGARIRAAREKKGLQQSDLAKQVSHARSYISDIEKGNSKPSLSILMSIADALGVSLNDLVYGSPDMVADYKERQIISIYENASDRKKDLLYNIFTNANQAVDQYDQADEPNEQ